jgi:biopolymer transport protein ExbB
MDVTRWLLSLALLGSDWLVYMLAGMSVAALVLSIFQVTVLLRTRSDLDALLRIIATQLFSGEKAHMDLIQKEISGMPGMEANVVRRGLERMDVGPAAVEEVIAGLVGLERITLMRGLNYLGVVGICAPFIGLFGTLLGLIGAFHALAEDPTGGPAVIMNGLSTALVPLAVGLLIAIAIFIVYYLILQRIRQRMAKLHAICHLLLGGMKTKH